MAATNNDRELLAKLSDLAKVEGSSIVGALNEQKAKAEQDRKSAEASYTDVQEKIEQKEEAKKKLEADIAELKAMLDQKAFAPFEESLGVLGLSESLTAVLEKFQKQAPETVKGIEDELIKLREKETEHDTAKREADIKVSEIDTSLPTVIADLQGMAAFLESALSNETGNITKNEIIGRLENINTNCPESFSESDMNRIAQLILFPDKLIEYFKTLRAEDEKAKGVGEVIAAAKEEAAAEVVREDAVVVAEEEPIKDDMIEEMKRLALSPEDFSDAELQAMRENYQPGIIETNMLALDNNLIEFSTDMPVELLVTKDLEEKITAILDKRKSIADIKNAIAVLLLPLETIRSLDLGYMPLWTSLNPKIAQNAKENEETLFSYGITLDDEDKEKYYPMMGGILPQDFADNMELLKHYSVSIIKKNKKPAIRVLAQQPAVLRKKLDAAIENITIQNVRKDPELLAQEIQAVSLRASVVLSGEDADKYDQASADIKEEETEIGTQLLYREWLNHLTDYVIAGKMEVNEDAYLIGGHGYSRRRVEKNLLRAAVAGIKDENIAFQIALCDGAFVEISSIQNAFNIMEINVQPKEGFIQGGVQ